jgi:predicted transport protein
MPPVVTARMARRPGGQHPRTLSALRSGRPSIPGALPLLEPVATGSPADVEAVYVALGTSLEGALVLLQTSMWRVEGAKPVPVLASPMDLEARLEDLIVADPDLLGPDQLLIIDRQVLTSHGKYLDILAIDEEARLHAIELKRDKTPRDVVAQVLDYGWWIRTLTLADVEDIWRRRTVDDGIDTDEIDLDTAYQARFAAPLDEETFNAEHKLTIIGATLDTATPRIIEYLADDYSVPVNAVVFSHFLDGDREYLSRTWLRPPAEDEVKVSPKRAHKGQKKAWNGRDIFVPLGRADDDPAEARWAHGIKYGFVGAGGGAPYWKFLRNVDAGMRVFAYVGKGGGYIAVGEVTGPLVPLDELIVDVDGHQLPFTDTPDCPQSFRDRLASGDPDMAEYAVPVDWQATRPLEDAVWETGLFANQLPCRLKDTRTIEYVEAEFGLSSGRVGFGELTPAERLEQVAPEVRDLFDQAASLCEQAGLVRTDLKWWVNFLDDTATPVVGIVIRKSGLRVYVDHPADDLADAGYQARDVTDVGHHGSGNTELTVQSVEDIGALQRVLEASFRASP